MKGKGNTKKIRLFCLTVLSLAAGLLSVAPMTEIAAPVLIPGTGIVDVQNSELTMAQYNSGATSYLIHSMKTSVTLSSLNFLSFSLGTISYHSTVAGLELKGGCMTASGKFVAILKNGINVYGVNTGLNQLDLEK